MKSENERAYELYVRQKIAAGIQAAEAGPLIPHEDVKKRFLPPPAIIPSP